jgi:hypothetical protein
MEALSTHFNSQRIPYYYVDIIEENILGVDKALEAAPFGDTIGTFCYRAWLTAFETDTNSGNRSGNKLQRPRCRLPY